ncbi:MAG TPA: acylphosphatase [Gemmatimonadota bacterium]|nr:acylphosphatase [Gemmatimonadota bacterium]
MRGSVQGVGFRWFVTRNAAALGVRGMVRNRADGAVEVVLQADESEPVAALVERIRSGPPGSRVQVVECEPMNGEPRYDGFEVVR